MNIFRAAVFLFCEYKDDDGMQEAYFVGLLIQKGVPSDTWIFNKPAVAGAVLQTASLLSQSAFSSISSKYHKSQRVRARELKL